MCSRSLCFTSNIPLGTARLSKNTNRRSSRALRVYSCANRSRTFAAVAAGIVLSQSVLNRPSPSPVFANEFRLESSALIAEDADTATKTKTAEELKEQSRRNTRVSGEASREYSKAVRFGAAGDFSSAEDSYRNVIRMSPDYAPAHSNLGNLLVSRGAFTEAIGEYSSAITLAPVARDSWLVLVNRGMTRLELADSRGALEDLNSADKLSPDNPDVLANRGYVWESMGKLDNALRDYSTAVRGGSVKPFWIRYGLTLFERGRIGDATGILNRVASDPKLRGDDVLAALTVCYFERGQTAEAETSWSLVERPRLYESRKFLEEQRRWPPRAITAMEKFRKLG